MTQNGDKTKVEQWSIFELALDGPAQGNPFLDVQFGAEFRYGHRVVAVDGFYDGDGVYKVRYMPDTLGTWSYVTASNTSKLKGISGQFECVSPSSGNHGPVRVRDVYHFGYADGTPYYQVGTTCYAWIHQEGALEEQTLATLKSAPFNKMRMCVFPKHYDYSKNEPLLHPYPATSDGRDWTRPDPAYFRHLEKRVADLMALGIEADLILFHPYDRWGYADMGVENDNRYLRYLVSRLAPFRNVWWSMANEFDFMPTKTEADWDRFFRIVQESDPYQHLRSIHNGSRMYDHGKPWVTHVSAQRMDTYKTAENTNEWRERYRKPVIIDEVGYEGDIQHGWGNLSPQELVRRFWEGTTRGGYMGHGETYLDPQEILWWSKGGVLKGESPARIAFLKKILEESPAGGLNPCWWNWDLIGSGKKGEYYLYYFGFNQPKFREFWDLPEEVEFRVEVIDTWEMTITPVPGTFKGGTIRVELPGKPYIAVRIKIA